MSGIPQHAQMRTPHKLLDAQSRAELGLTRPLLQDDEQCDSLPGTPTSHAGSAISRLIER